MRNMYGIFKGLEACIYCPVKYRYILFEVLTLNPLSHMHKTLKMSQLY